MVNVVLFSFGVFQIAQKYDPQKEEELRFWIEEVTGMSIGDNFQRGLKDGVILCDPAPQPHQLLIGSCLLQLENLGNFIKANDLFENGNMTQVQTHPTTLLALASMVSTPHPHPPTQTPCWPWPLW
uniref:Calponin-homology (CH) domain-containing protein n=1 Tax=Sphaeramia orbicularis TaxID=375764 RepID=A0A672Y7W4_9TELE